MLWSPVTNWNICSDQILVKWRCAHGQLKPLTRLKFNPLVVSLGVEQKTIHSFEWTKYPVKFSNSSKIRLVWCKNSRQLKMLNISFCIAQTLLLCAKHCMPRPHTCWVILASDRGKTDWLLNAVPNIDFQLDVSFDSFFVVVTVLFVCFFRFLFFSVRGHFEKCLNALCLSPQILHKPCFTFLKGLPILARENKQIILMRNWRGQTRVIWYFLKWPIAISSLF